MIKKDVVKLSMLSLVTAVALGVTGCGSSGGSPDNNINPSNEGSEPTASVTTGKAVDGYLVYSTVCLDLNKDGYCQLDSEPVTSTDVNGSFELNITVAHKQHLNYATAPLLVYGGYDADTQADFTGKLKAPFSGGREANVTPMTSMLEAMIAKGKKAEDAEALIQNMFDLNGTDLGADPVALAKTKPQLLNASLQIHKSIEVLAKALENVGSDKKANDLVEDLYAQFAQGMDKDRDLDALLDYVVEQNDKLDDKAKEGAKSVSGQIKQLISTEEGVSNTAIIATQIGAIQREIEVKVIEEGGDIADLESRFATIHDKDFAQLHAEEILYMVGYSDESTDFDTLATKVKEVLVAAGMTTQYLAIEKEIAALKANSATEEIGTAFEEAINKHKDSSDSIKDLTTATVTPFTVPMTFYTFDKYDNEKYPQYSHLRYQEHALKTDGVFEEKEMDLNQSSGTFEAFPGYDDKNFVLVNGKWEKEKTPSSYTLSADKTELTVGNALVKIIKEVDLTKSEEGKSMLRKQISPKYTNEWIKSQSFSEGAKAYILAFKENEKYEVYYQASNDYQRDANGIYQLIPLTSIVSYMGGRTQIASQTVGFNNSKPVYFARNVGNQDFYSSPVIDSNGKEVSTLTEGQHGDLVTYTDNTMNTIPTTSSSESLSTAPVRNIKQKVVGSWKVIKLPNSETLAVVTTPKNNISFYKEGAGLITLMDGTVYVGRYEKAMEEFEVSEELNLNEVAFTDLMELIKQ